MQIPNMGSTKEMNRYWLTPPRNFDPERYQERLKGEMELLFPAPPARKLVWMNLGGFFASYQSEKASETANEIWYQASNSTEWKCVHRSNIPPWHDHWHYSWDREIRLDELSDYVRVRYVGNPGVNGIRVNLHSIKPGEVPGKELAVTHGYEIDGELIEETVLLEGSRDYIIDCRAEPRNVYIKMEVPSGSK
jgi:hypothetical protein